MTKDFYALDDEETNSNEQLLSDETETSRDVMKMTTIASPLDRKRLAEVTDTSFGSSSLTNVESIHQGESDAGRRSVTPPQEYRVYKRRWFGLVQLVLLNIIVSWDWLTFSAVSKTSSEYFDVSETDINWLSTAFLFAFVAISPVVLWTLHFGPKPAILASSGLILGGNWIRYGGARSNSFAVVMFGQILIGLAQPFVLAAPTRYSDLWFTDRGRISATAVASLANPFGGALGQLIGPLLATKSSEVPTMVLYTAVISSVAAIPSFFVPATPPTPPSSSSELPKTPIRSGIRALSSNYSFWLVFVPFSIYVGFFNALSSLLNQVLFPYGFTEEQAGIGGALLIVVGLLSSAIVSPIIDRTHAYKLTLKLLTPLIGISYLCFLFAPPTASVAAPFVILAVLGASSFSLVPVALEYLVEVTWPASPEVSSVINWTGGQLLGAIFIIIMGALKDQKGEHGPKNNMQKALIFEAVIAIIVIPFPMFLGIKRLGLGGEERRRFQVDESETRGVLGDSRRDNS